MYRSSPRSEALHTNTKIFIFWRTNPQNPTIFPKLPVPSTSRCFWQCLARNWTELISSRLFCSWQQQRLRRKNFGALQLKPLFLHLSFCFRFWKAKKHFFTFSNFTFLKKMDGKKERISERLWNTFFRNFNRGRKRRELRHSSWRRNLRVWRWE